MTVKPLPDPRVALYRQLGEAEVEARHLTARLERELARIDGLREKLRGEGVTVDIDLGAVGNQAASARRAEAAGQAATTFALPKPVPAAA